MNARSFLLGVIVGSILTLAIEHLSPDVPQDPFTCKAKPDLCGERVSK